MDDKTVSTRGKQYGIQDNSFETNSDSDDDMEWCRIAQQLSPDNFPTSARTSSELLSFTEGQSLANLQPDESNTNRATFIIELEGLEPDGMLLRSAPYPTTDETCSSKWQISKGGCSGIRRHERRLATLPI